MQFRENVAVLGADGEKVGEVDGVILDPTDKEVTHIVVEQGFLFTTDKILPVHVIEEAGEERVALNLEAQELEQLSDFEESQFVQLPEAEIGEPGRPGRAPQFYWYPPIGMTWGTGGQGNLDVAVPALPSFLREEEEVPEEAMVLREGATVISSDGENVGTVEAVVTAPEEDRATHLVLAQGLLLTEEKCIPTSWISTLMGGEVHLAVGSEMLKNLPEYGAAC